MGSGESSRPKFSRDIKTPPRTDRIGSEKQYFHNAKDWKRFHDLLPDKNSNKISKRLHGLILRSQLFRRALELCKKISESEIEGENGTLDIARTVHYCDPL